MLLYDKLSYWEKVTYLQDVDYLIIGSGIVGLNTALSIKAREKHAKILVLERGYLPTGASTKNAGFACFGSPSELLYDLKLMGEEKTSDLLKLRWNGLLKLREMVDDAQMDYQACGSYDLFRGAESTQFQDVLKELPFLNDFIEKSIGLKDCYSTSYIPQQQGMKDLCGSIYNQYEGAINTGKMMNRLFQKSIESGIYVLFGVDVSRFDSSLEKAFAITNFGNIEAKQLLICTNGFSKKMLPELDIKPARAQVLVTSPIADLKLNSTYHYDAGYYYFRVVDGNRILIGGARNQDFDGETTDELETTTFIKEHIEKLLREVIVPNHYFRIDYEWAGIMGVGSEKTPLIGSHSPRIHYAVRMGGMGVAMGSEIGVRLAELVLSK